jgi:zinc/manganese transport system permease protein
VQRFSPLSRGHHLFAATSFKPSITNACLATLRLSLAFSAYSCLSEWAILGQRGGSIVFYLLFALAVTAAVLLVGVFLVFTSLIIPALAIRQLRGARALITGYALGAAGYALGLVLSALFDLPSGAVVVWALAALTAGSSLSRAALIFVRR